MRLFTSMCVCALSVACAKQVPVEIALQETAPTPGDRTLVPKFVELEHLEEGWVRVNVDPGSGSADAGLEVPLATAELPKGRYSAIRFGYDALRPRKGDGSSAYRPESGGVSGREPGDTSDARGGTGAAHPSNEAVMERVSEEIIVRQPFCIQSNDTEIVLEVSRTHPSAEQSAQVTVRAPDC